VFYIYVKKLNVITSRWHNAINKQLCVEITPFLRRVSVTKQFIYYEGHGNGIRIYFTSICKASILIISYVAIITIVLLGFKIWYRSIMNPEFIFTALYLQIL